MAGIEDYLTEAAMADNPPSGTFYDPDHATATTKLQSLGVFEHWNNAVDRKYSRNLGTGNGIELVMVEDVSSSVHRLTKNTECPSGFLLHRIGVRGDMEISVPGACELQFALFDGRGRNFGTILHGYRGAGRYQITLESLTGRSAPLAAGNYILALFSRTKGELHLVEKFKTTLF
jgi:hypothetical protein